MHLDKLTKIEEQLVDNYLLEHHSTIDFPTFISALGYFLPDFRMCELCEKSDPKVVYDNYLKKIKFDSQV